MIGTHLSAYTEIFRWTSLEYGKPDEQASSSKNKRDTLGNRLLRMSHFLAPSLVLVVCGNIFTDHRHQHLSMFAIDLNSLFYERQNRAQLRSQSL